MIGERGMVWTDLLRSGHKIAHIYGGFHMVNTGKENNISRGNLGCREAGGYKKTFFSKHFLGTCTLGTWLVIFTVSS